MALVFVGPRSIDGAVSYVRMSDVFTADRKRILEPVQALASSPTTCTTTWTLPTARSWSREGMCRAIRVVFEGAAKSATADLVGALSDAGPFRCDARHQ
jgi:hypothetical protein